MRVRAAIAAFALVACTLLVGWHKATVFHGVCVEHGDELHLDRVADHACEQDGRSGTTDQIESSAWQLVDGDHHCQIIATARGPVTAPAAADAAVPAALDEDPTPPALPAPAALALYRLAPKTSPPV